MTLPSECHASDCSLGNRSGQRPAEAVLCGQGGNQGPLESPRYPLGPGLEHEEPDEVKLGHDLDWLAVLA